MHYTRWEREDKLRPRLLAEDSDTELAVFDTTASTARVGDETWQLTVDKKEGASASVAHSSYRLPGNLRKDKRFRAELGADSYLIYNEDMSDWIVENAAGVKVAQFSGREHGVRSAILEFEEGVQLPMDHIVALSWFARLVLETRLARGNNALLITLVLLTIVALLVFFL